MYRCSGEDVDHPLGCFFRRQHNCMGGVKLVQGSMDHVVISEVCTAYSKSKIHEQTPKLVLNIYLTLQLTK